jgi:indolepyruvate ferredoxin oxidoreductase, alpha subunit
LTSQLPSNGTPIRGDLALAHGALAAGVSLVTGYPGSPATGVFDALLELAPEDAYVHWAPNEKVAMEMGMGASLAGRRALVVLKSVGLNVALDPLATFSYSGAFGGLVILVGDDPQGWSSQNEQDSRWLARLAELPLIEPTDVGQAAALLAQAYAWSEAHRMPIIVRITTGLSLDRAPIAQPWQLPPPVGVFPRQRGRWVVLPENVVKRRRTLHRRLRELAQDLALSPFDHAHGQGPLGVLAVGHAWAKLVALLGDEPPLSALALSSTFPLPEEPLLRWLASLERLLVLEEGGPFIEQELRALLQRRGLALQVLGRQDRTMPEEGELSGAHLAAGLKALAPDLALPSIEEHARSMPSKTPLCEGCGYWPVMQALVNEMEAHGGRRQHIVVGETGCMVRGDLPPLELFDVKYSLGASLGIGLGLALAGGQGRSHPRVVTLVGDSAFFHTNLNALPQIVQAHPPMTVIILDNRVTALTGGQVHPGTPQDERGAPRPGADIAAVLRAYGIQPALASPDDPVTLREAIAHALTCPGPSFVLAHVPCVRYATGGSAP